MTIQRKTTTAKEAESIIGQLGHLGMAIPYVHHFLSRLRDLQRRAMNRQSIPIYKECCKDHKAMTHIIKILHDGISINIIVDRRPVHIYHSDSCLEGLGVYSNSGFAWQYHLEPEHQFQATNNLLDHIVAIITLWVDIIHGRLRSGNSTLSMTNITTSKGWLCKTNFSKLDDDPIQATVRLEVARMHTTHYITVGIREYSWWFPGEAKVVADSLSRDDNKTDSKLTNLFCTHCPSQTPEHFFIQPLPKEKTSWLIALLLRLPVKPQLQEKHTRIKLGCGNDGQPIAAGLDCLTHSSIICHATQESNSLEHLPWLCRKLGFQDHLMTDWLTAQSQVPSHMYVRPSANAANPTHP
jgi:hypothetical protein